MTLTLNSRELLATLSLILKVIPKKPSIAILASALFSERDGQYFITGASSSAQLSIPIDIRRDTTDKSEFSPFCIEAALLHSLVSTLPDQPITFDIAPNEVKISYLGGHFSMAGSTSAADYIQMQPLKAEHTSFSMPADVLIPHLRGALPCATVNDTLRPVLGAVLLDVSAEGINTVAADGRLLYRNQYQHGVPFLASGSPAQILLPRDMAAVALVAFDKAELISISFDGEMAILSAGNTILSTRVVEGRYPNYDLVIPKNNSYHIDIPQCELTAVLKRVSVAASIHTQLVTLAQIDGETFLLSEDIDYGRAGREKLPVTSVTLPDGFRFAMNYAHLLRGLPSITTDNLRIEYESEIRPAVVRELDTPTPALLLVMPMKA